MLNQFVEHLKRQGLLTPEQSARVLAWSERRHDPIGIIAVEHGLITGRQIDEILAAQRNQDLLFGQLAVDLGHLTPIAVEMLVRVQTSRQWAQAAEAVALAQFIPFDDILRAYARFVLDHVGSGAAAKVAA